MEDLRGHKDQPKADDAGLPLDGRVTSALAQVPWQTLLAGLLVVALVSTVAFVIRAILTGRLVPRNAVDDIRADRDKWETAWRTQQEAFNEFDDRMDANTEALRLIQQLVEALATKGPAT